MTNELKQETKQTKLDRCAFCGSVEKLEKYIIHLCESCQKLVSKVVKKWGN